MNFRPILFHNTTQLPTMALRQHCYLNDNLLLRQDLISNCASLQRIANIADSKDIAMDNIDQFLNDYIHIICQHDNVYDLKQIKRELIDKYNHKQCDISNCPHFNAHFRRDEQKRNETNDQELTDYTKSLFYKEHLNQLHCFLFHLFDISLRTDIDFNPKYDETVDNQYFDYRFKRMRDLILTKRGKYLGDVDRYTNENSKYNLKTIGMCPVLNSYFARFK